jgi:flap endonuclease-1
MGIKGLSKFLQKKAPQAYKKIIVDNFKYKKIAIDASIIMYQYMYAANKLAIEHTNLLVEELNRDCIIHTWIEYTINYICNWLAYGVIPVFVFDGPGIKEKKKTLDIRKISKKEKKMRIDELYVTLKSNPLLFPSASLTELTNLLATYINITEEDRILYKEVIKSTGIPCFDAIGDAEQLCTMLCIEKYVEAVYTKDSDVLPLCCPLLITGFSKEYIINEYGYPDVTLDVINIIDILNSLNITKETFIDLCIMCGTDYNQNMKGIGPMKAYKLLLKYEQFNKIPYNEIKKNYKKLTDNEVQVYIDNLSYNVCLNIFKEAKCKDLIIDGDLDNIKLIQHNNNYPTHINKHIYKLKIYYKDINTHI